MVALNNKLVWIDFLIFIRNTLLVGENYFSWPLWYLLVLIVSVIILRILIKNQFKPLNIFFLELFMTCLGLVLNQLIDTPTGTIIDIPVKLYKIGI